MSAASDRFAELREILEALCEERVTAVQTARLEELALNDPAARRFYLEYIDLHGNLHWDAAQGHLAEEEEFAFAEKERALTPHFQPAPTPAVNIASQAARRPARRSRVALIAAGIAATAVAALALFVTRESFLTRPDAKERADASAERTLPAPKGAHALAKGPRPASTNGPAKADDAARAKTSAASARSVGTASPSRSVGVAAHRRPARFRLAVAKNAVAGAKAALLPLETKRGPVRALTAPLETPAPTNVDPDGMRGPVDPVPFLNARLASGWKTAGMEPSPIATDEEWIRRVYLDVVGHIPPEEEVNAFLDEPGRKKRAALVERLLRDPGYSRNWATLWTNLLVGRQPRTPGVQREELEKFLRDSFAAGVPWNEIVEALVSAEGTSQKNPASNFLLAHLNQDAVPATALTARLFLGVQVRCTQCHDHPFTKDKQDRFWELNSFFQQTEVVTHAGPSSGIASAVVRPADAVIGPMEAGQAVVAEIVTRRVGGPIYYETLRGEMRAAFPAYAGHKIDPGPAVNRRRELGRLIARGESPQLALAMVNRTWQHFFGHGFTHPVDDMGPHNAPIHPDVLNRLAKEFVASGYDLKQLVRWICATDAYQRASTLEAANAFDDPANGAAPLFSRVYLKPLTAEELYDSLLVATRARSSARTGRNDAGWNDAGRGREDWVQQFVMRYTTEDNDEAPLPAGSISQALTMMNDPIVEAALAGEPGTLLYDVAHDAGQDAGKIRRLSRSALSRNPTPAELDTALVHLDAARQTAGPKKDRERAVARALADIFWAYLNASEFALVH